MAGRRVGAVHGRPLTEWLEGSRGDRDQLGDHNPSRWYGDLEIQGAAGRLWHRRRFRSPTPHRLGGNHPVPRAWSIVERMRHTFDRCRSSSRTWTFPSRTASLRPWVTI